MASKAPTNSRIFFKDKQNELKGPFTESQMQQSYRDNCFESSFSFYFVTGEDGPTEETEFVTLESLRSLNGSCCPFAAIIEETSDEELEKMITNIETLLTGLSNKCDEVNKLEKRVEEIERKLREVVAESVLVADGEKEHSVSGEIPNNEIVAEKEENLEEEKVNITIEPPVTEECLSSTFTAESTTDTGVTEKPVTYREFRDFVNFFLHTCDHFAAGEKMTFEVLAENISEMAKDTQELLFKELVKALEYETYFFCSFCDRFMFTPRQTFMHIGSHDHVSKVNKIAGGDQSKTEVLMNMVGKERLFRMFEQEKAQIKRLRKKYKSTSLDNKLLRPQLEQMSFDQAFEKTAKNLGKKELLKRMLKEDKRAAFAKDVIGEIQADDTGVKLMNQLEAHIGTAKTRCLDCKLVFADAAGYFEHLRTFNHIRNADSLDLKTLVVNLMKRESCGELPWPDMTDD